MRVLHKNVSTRGAASCMHATEYYLHRKGTISRCDLLHVQNGVGRGTISLETFDFHQFPHCKRHCHFRQIHIPEVLNYAH